MEETLRDVAVAAGSTEIQMCRNMQALSNGQNLTSAVCEPYWPKTTAVVITATPQNTLAGSGDSTSVGVSSEDRQIGIPDWAEQVRDRPETIDKSSTSYEGDNSPMQMAELGRTMGSRAELRAMESMFARTRSSVASRCCGSNQECLNVFRQVRLQFCTNPRATTHPNEPDRCTGRDSGVFTNTDDENLMVWWLLRMRREPADVQEATRASVLQDSPQLRNRLGQVAPGMVSISRYERADDGGETLWTFRHELGHACSSIRRQIATRDGSTLAAGDDYDPDPQAYCRYNSQGFQQFSFMGDFMHPENARETGTCISNGIREEFRNSSDQSYIANACYGAKIEEGLAEAFALLTATPEDVMYNLERSCTFPPSRVHFTGHKIVQCIAQNSPRFRNTVLAAPICRLNQQQAEATSTTTEGGLVEGLIRPFMNNVRLLSPTGVVPTPSGQQPPASNSQESQDGQQ